MLSPKAPVQTGRFALVDVARLRAGVTLANSILEDTAERQVVLVGSGVTLNAEHLANLCRRGISQVRVDRAELGRIVTPQTGEPRGSVRVALRPAALSSGEPRPASAVGRARPVDPRMVQRFVECSEAALRQLDDLFQGLNQGDVSQSDRLQQVSRLNVEQFAADRDAFLLSSILPGSDYMLSRHSLQVSKLATAIAAAMGRSPEEIAELNTGCLVHDVGMQRIDQRLLDSPRNLSEIEYLEITKHPAITFELIRNVRSLPTGARMVAYQMHERINGSGYPRQRRGEQIHPLARIAAVADVYVADVYVALVSPRAYRPAMLPYSAMEHLVRGSRSGLFDRAVVRAFLETVSMFPIGSYVELSDGRTGRVVRANPDKYTAPVVQVERDNESDDSDIVDLSQEQGLSIVRPLPNPAKKTSTPERIADPEPLPTEKPDDQFWE